MAHQLLGNPLLSQSLWAVYRSAFARRQNLLPRLVPALVPAPASRAFPILWTTSCMPAVFLAWVRSLIRALGLGRCPGLGATARSLSFIFASICPASFFSTCVGSVESRRSGLCLVLCWCYLRQRLDH